MQCHKMFAHIVDYLVRDIRQIQADCGNLHWVGPPMSRYGHLQYGALRRRLEQEPSTHQFSALLIFIAFATY